MLATERRPTLEAPAPAENWDAGIWLTLLFMCAGQYFTTLVTDLGLHFYFETVVLFTTLTILLAILVKDEIVAWIGAPPPEAVSPS
jgi:hypothetical protein